MVALGVGEGSLDHLSAMAFANVDSSVLSDTASLGQLAGPFRDLLLPNFGKWAQLVWAQLWW
jgi:hypothetical protein